MKPASSVILLTTLIGVAQGMFVALFCAELFDWVEADNRVFFLNGALTSFSLLSAGLLASFFHLGRPERAWRAAAMWRTSWLSREVIALPIAMLVVAAYAGAHYSDYTAYKQSMLSTSIGTIGVLAMLVLFVCTGMIYACIKFLQEWASPLTVVNFTLLGLASGFVLTTVYAGYYAPEAAKPMTYIGLVLMLFAFLFKLVSLWGNNHIKLKSTPQTAIGIRHSKISQQAVGFMGGSFNTREFFHGKSKKALDIIMQLSLVMVFLIPAILFAISLYQQPLWILTMAFIVHFLGLLLERWHFFAQAQHPQNLYYQTDH